LFSLNFREIRGGSRSYEIYRILQVLNNIFNNCFSSLYVLAFLYSIVMMTTIILVVLIKFHSSLSIFQLFLLCMYSSVSTVVIAVTFPIAGKLYHSSLYFINYMEIKPIMSNYDTMFLKSCYPLKFKICFFNCFQRTTTLMAYGFITFVCSRVVVFSKSKI